MPNYLGVAAGWRPRWALDIRIANNDQDAKGQDLLITTDKGDLPLQVKSSKSALGISSPGRRGARRHIPVIVVGGKDLARLTTECWIALETSYVLRGGVP